MPSSATPRCPVRHRFIPFHVYFNRAMDAMYDNLKTEGHCHRRKWCAPRRAVPLAHGATGHHGGKSAGDQCIACAADAITFSANTLTIPQ